MKTLFKYGACLITLSLLFSHAQLWAQGSVINGDFETAEFENNWTFEGDTENLELVDFATAPGPISYSLRREVGPPGFEGTIKQDVFMQAGVSYKITADVASDYLAC